MARFSERGHAGRRETPASVADSLRLPNHVVQLLLDQEDDRRLLDMPSAASNRVLPEPDCAGLTWWLLCLSHGAVQRAGSTRRGSCANE